MSTSYDPTIEGRIFDLERYSTHDGPGIRTTIFLKGCYLNCQWCHNPESISPRPELLFDPDKCLLDLGCAAACSQGALYFADQEGNPIPPEQIGYFRSHKEKIGKRVYNADLCLRCGRCAEVCYARALELVGRTIAVAEAVAELERDRAFYDNSGGGITVSGGEPLYQARFTEHLLAACQERGLHTALDTAAYAKWETLAAVLAHVDLVLLDLKVMDGDKHRQYTGVDNALILDNARRLARLMAAREKAGKGSERIGVWIRVPVIPGINDDDDNLCAAARLVREEMSGAVKVVELLGYHPLGKAKFKRLGRQPALGDLKPPSKEHLRDRAQRWREELKGTGIRVNAR